MKYGIKYELTYTVTNQDLAKNLAYDKHDQFPEVLATSKMIALMELAAARLMAPILTSEELSVGVNINVDHLAATPINATVKALATYKGKSDKIYRFDVALYDDSGKVGLGTHTRAVVNTDRLVKGAEARVQPKS